MIGIRTQDARFEALSLARRIILEISIQSGHGNLRIRLIGAQKRRQRLIRPRGGRRWGGGPGGYLRRFRRRRHHGGWWRQPTFLGSWGYWPRWYQYWPLPCNCKRGCTPDGCAVPGTGPDDCVWASDCNCCGNVYY